MSWLWFAGPLWLLLIYLGISVWPPAEERRLRSSLQRWLDDYLGPLVVGKKVKTRLARALPSAFQGLVEQAGGGTRVADIVLLPKLAYLAVRFANAEASTNQFTVLCKLAKTAPSFSCRPLPLVDGRPAPNTGVRFPDEEFMDLFIAEGSDRKAVQKWLKPNLREALMELPDVWLRVQGKTMAITVYGQVDPEKLDELVGVADALYAERGAAGGESLFGDEDPIGKAELDEAPAPELAPVADRIKASALDVGLYVVGGLWLAAILGRFASFHPAVFFASPDLGVSEQWQGGWTTKGVGMFIMAEAFLTLVFGFQAYFGATLGQSIGKRLFGIKVVRLDGSAPGFLRGVVLRSWIFGLIPLAVAAATAKPLSMHAFFAKIPAPLTLGVAAAVVALRAVSFASSKERRGVHDLLAGTKMVLTAPWRLPAIQLGVARGLDPLMFKRISTIGMLVVGFVVANIVAQVFNFGFWLY